MAGTGRISTRPHRLHHLSLGGAGLPRKRAVLGTRRGEQLLATRLAERRGSGAPLHRFDALAAGYLDDYGVSAGGCPTDGCSTTAAGRRRATWSAPGSPNGWRWS